MELGFQGLGVVAGEVEGLKTANVVRRRSLWTMHKAPLTSSLLILRLRVLKSRAVSMTLWTV